MPPAFTPAWVCAPGVLKVPFLRQFLPEYDLRPLPGPDIRTVIGWGLKPTAAHGRRWAEKRGLPYVALEDGFLRSVGLGEAGATALSLVVDDQGIYYDAARPSRLETLIATAADWCDAAMADRAQALIDRIVAARLSKTNMGGSLDHALLQPGRRVLVVDQTFGDAAIRHGLADEARFTDMLAAARDANPGAQIIVKRHPAVAAGLKRGCIPDAALAGVTVLDQDIHPADLLDAIDEVHCVTSALGFEALLRARPVHCWGVPFYAGWGLTQDNAPSVSSASPPIHLPQRGRIETHANPPPLGEGDHGVVEEAGPTPAARWQERRGQATLPQLAAAALIAYPRYIDPVTGRACSPEQAVDRLVSLRARADRLAGSWSGAGFAPAKRPAVRRLLTGPKSTVRVHWFARNAAREAEASGGRMIWWAGKETDPIRAAAAATCAPTVRMEDGFIRSRGLGSDFVGALSVALDDLGVYYDPSRPSRLEALIQAGAPSPEAAARAAALRTRVVEAGLSKYNLDRPDARPDWPADRPILLVVGQVENDKSILLGCEDIRTNAGLVAAARADHPDAFLVYRNHPDVLAGNRPGLLDAAALAEVDAVADELDIIDCVNACDRLATLTSLSGFEALLRGKTVSVYGRPFYAGWGLTRDRLDLPRRTRRASLDDLVYAALIAYPIYVTPDGWPCEAEDLVEALIAAQDEPRRSAPRGRLRRWWTGVQASLDRRPPPAY